MATNNEHKNKILKNKLTITKSDKGKTLVITTQEEYKHKTINFIHDNNFTTKTQQYQKIVKQTFKQCSNIIQKEDRWKYMNMNPTAPNLHATVKLHNQNAPIRPIINWKNPPTYGLAKQLSKTLHSYPQLPYTYNIRNSSHLMADLQATEPNKDMRLCSFDMENAPPHTHARAHTHTHTHTHTKGKKPPPYAGECTTYRLGISEYIKVNNITL
jgi:hypothetical protein